MSNLTVHLKALKKLSKHSQEKQTAGNNQLSAEINKLETKRTIQRINETKSLFFEKIIKIDQTLTEFPKREYPNKQNQK